MMEMPMHEITPESENEGTHDLPDVGRYGPPAYHCPPAVDNKDAPHEAGYPPMEEM